MSTLLTSTPEITVDGKKYPVKRLGINAAFKLIAVIRAIGTGKAVNAFIEIYNQMSSGEQVHATPEEAKAAETQKNTRVLAASSVIIENLEKAEAECYALGAALLNVTVEEFQHFPLDVLPQLIEAVMVHPDLKVFTHSVKVLMDKTKPVAAAATAPIAR